MSCNFINVLQQYLEIHENPVGSNGNLPFRLFNYIIKEEEFEGECLDLLLNHLKSSVFPDILAFALARNAFQQIASQDLSEAIKTDDDQNKSYETIKIVQVLFSLVHTLCKNWQTSLPSSVLSQPKPLKYSEFGIKNTRRKMEDRHSVIPNLNLLLGLQNCPVIQWYAVYDGHGGLDASHYASKQLHLKFAQEDGFLNDVAQSLKSSILKTDQEFCVKSKNERLRSGTTAVISVIVEQTLHVAWVGDSQALLVKDGKPITIMNPHKPDRADEKQRIEDLGGCVVWFGAWRVNGTLSVSRAIGDADHKPFISGEADTFSLLLDGTEDFLCLACDGFWDVFNGEDLVRLMREYFKEKKDCEGVAEFLCYKAKTEGSSDNITVVVIFLRDNIKIEEEPTVDDAAEANEISNTQKRDPLDGNENNNNNANNEGSLIEPNNDGLNLLQGHQLELEQKIKIPHKLLYNYVRNKKLKDIEKGTVVVTDSSPHAKLPHSIRNPKLENLTHPPSMLLRRDTAATLLSLAAVESVTELPSDKHKRERDNNSSQLPCIFNNSDERSKVSPRRSSFATTMGLTRKPLGYRAPNMLNRSRPRLPFRASIVGTRQRGHSRSPSPRRSYASSIPEDIHSRHENGPSSFAVTNSLAPSLRPRQQVAHKSRQIVKLVHRDQRRRSRSLF